MISFSKLFLPFTLSVLLLACGNNSQRESAYANEADSESSSTMSEQRYALGVLDEELSADYIIDSKEIEAASPAVQNSDLSAVLYASETSVTDTMKNLLRTANLKFRVKNIVQATLTIEDIVNNYGGYIENTQLRSSVNRQYSVQTNADSVVYTNYCTATNSIIIRIPNKNFNTTLKAFVPIVDYLEHRDISANNITIDLIANQYAKRRAFSHAQRLKKAVDNKPAKLENVVDAENSITRQQEQEDNAKISMLQLRDKIDFSTIYLQIYQDNIVDVKSVAIIKNTDTYQPSFGSRLLSAFKTGWQTFEGIILFFADMWTIILFIVLVIWLLRRYYLKSRRNGGNT